MRWFSEPPLLEKSSSAERFKTHLFSPLLLAYHYIEFDETADQVVCRLRSLASVMRGWPKITDQDQGWNGNSQLSFLLSFVSVSNFWKKLAQAKESWYQTFVKLK